MHTHVAHAARERQLGYIFCMCMLYMYIGTDKLVHKSVKFKKIHTNRISRSANVIRISEMQGILPLRMRRAGSVVFSSIHYPYFTP